MMSATFNSCVTFACEMQITISVHPSNVSAVEKCMKAGLGDAVIVEDDEAFEQAIEHTKP